MSLVSSLRSGTRPPLTQDRSGSTSTSPPTGQLEADVPLPRHLLVALAGIAADVTALRQRLVDDPQLHEPVDRILGRIDDLVDSIYERAAELHPRPVAVAASSMHGSASTADHPAAALAVPAWSGEHRASRP
jgi:hypothetical protein